MSVVRSWSRVKEIARKINRELVLGKSIEALRDLRVEFVKAYEEYINSLPEDKREDMFGHFRGKLIRKKDIPKLLLEDDKLFEMFVRVYGR